MGCTLLYFYNLLFPLNIIFVEIHPYGFLNFSIYYSSVCVCVSQITYRFLMQILVAYSFTVINSAVVIDIIYGSWYTCARNFFRGIYLEMVCIRTFTKECQILLPFNVACILSSTQQAFVFMLGYRPRPCSDALDMIHAISELKSPQNTQYG
jgi:hypothetical protein